MTTPSPFEVSRMIGNNLSAGFRESREKSAIDEILTSAIDSQDPEQYQKTMSMILKDVRPENQKNVFDMVNNRAKQLADQRDQQKKQDVYEERGLNPYLPESINKVDYENRLQDQALQNALSGRGIAQKNVNAQQPPNQDGEVPNVAGSVQKVNPEQSQGQGLQYQDLDEETLVQMSGIKKFKSQAENELKRRQEDRKARIKENTMTFQGDLARADELLKKADKISTDTPKLESSLNLWENAIADKNMDFFSRDNLAEMTGIEGFRSKEGSIFKTAGKEFFLGSIKKAGARPNQWIEQQIADMMAKVGRDQSANLSVTRAMRNEMDLDKEEARLTYEVSDEMLKEGNRSRSGLGREVGKRLAVYAEDKQKELFNDLKAIKSIDEQSSQKLQRVKPGTKVSPYVVDALLITFGNDAEKAMIEAKKLGYTIDD